MTVEYDKQGNIGVITINRPDARNAVNADVAQGIESAIDQIEDDPEVWVGILTGARTEKGYIFCAGADLKAMNTDPGGMQTEKGGFGGFVTRERTKPVIAAVDGPALAGGTELVLACDLVVASDAAKFGIPEVKRGLAAAAGGLVRLPRQVPPRLAMELALTGDLVSAEDAYRFGLVNRVVAADELQRVLPRVDDERLRERARAEQRRQPKPLHLLVLVGFILFFAAYPPTNVKRLLRHPQLTGVALWGVGHLFANGESRSIVLFGGLTLWAIAEIVVINRRDGARDKPAPVPAKNDVILAGGGIVAYVVVVAAHQWLFGVAPFHI